jgi:hypothetical protein
MGYILYDEQENSSLKLYIQPITTVYQKEIIRLLAKICDYNKLKLHSVVVGSDTGKWHLERLSFLSYHPMFKSMKNAYNVSEIGSVSVTG